MAAQWTMLATHGSQCYSSGRSDRRGPSRTPNQPRALAILQAAFDLAIHADVGY
jgi:hypothetical protein